MADSSLIDQLPLSVVFSVFFFSILVTLGLGYQFSQSLIKKGSKGGYGPMSGGIASLLAFILALTFSMTATRNNDRKSLVVEEANAIGTVYLRADLLPSPFKEEAKSLLRDYIDLRIRSASKTLVDRIKNSEKLQIALWKQVVELHKVDKNVSIMLYTEALNAMIDIHTLRLNKGLHGRVPSAIWLTLFALTFIGVMLIGLQSGEKDRRNVLVGSIPFALALSIVLILIVELDRPTRSVMTISQGALIDLQKSVG
ncbi:MAG TPA: DUF4239 domain-containing protein [Psychromonas hadalis]|nr:DUF4239 domain-containing protein [Psychromonas hadalis]